MYKVIWLKEGQELAAFKGEIISILDKKFESGYVHNLYSCEGYWAFQCLVKINSEKELINEKEKKIKDLTKEERRKICDKHIYNKCEGCPFMLEARDNGQWSDVVVKYCVHHILNVLEKEVTSLSFLN